MMKAYSDFVKHANNSDINDVLLALYNQSQSDERYLNEIIEYHRSDDYSEEFKELLNQNMGPDFKSDQLFGRLVSGIKEKPMESKVVKFTC